MNREDMRATLQETLGAILDRDDLCLPDSVQAAEVAGWDSLAHLKLLVALEPALGVKFRLSEMNASADVGELIDLIISKRLSKT